MDNGKLAGCMFDVYDRYLAVISNRPGAPVVGFSDFYRIVPGVGSLRVVDDGDSTFRGSVGQGGTGFVPLGVRHGLVGDGLLAGGCVEEASVLASGEDDCRFGDAGGHGSEPLSGERGVDALGRGPNYARNKANRMRRKIQAEERKLAAAEARGRAEAVREGSGVGARFGGWRDSRLSEEEVELKKLKVERQIIQEKRKLDKLKSPTQIIIDAMQMVRFAEQCAKRANDSKVAAWAATLSSASAESIARSGSLPSVESVSSKSPAVAKPAVFWDVVSQPLNDVERWLVSRRIMTEKSVVTARSKKDRKLMVVDFRRPSCPVKLNAHQLDVLVQVERGVDPEIYLEC